MKKLTMFLGVLGVMAITPLANANLQLSYQLDAAVAVACASVAGSPNTSAVCFSGVPTNIGSNVIMNTFSGTGDQTLQPTELFSSVLRIQNNDTSQHVLQLWVVDQDFTTPTAPPAITWSSNLTITSTTGTGTVAMMSCLDTTNGLAPPTGAFCSAGPSLANLTQNYSGVSTPPQDTVSTLVNALASPYSIGEHITVTLGAGSSMNLIASQVLTTVPEPMSVSLLGGVLLVTVGAIRRKLGQARS